MSTLPWLLNNFLYFFCIEQRKELFDQWIHNSYDLWSLLAIKRSYARFWNHKATPEGIAMSWEQILEHPRKSYIHSLKKLKILS